MKAFICLVFLVGTALAWTPADSGSTVMAPAGGNAAAGQTILTASSGTTCGCLGQPSCGCQATACPCWGQRDCGCQRAACSCWGTPNCGCQQAACNSGWGCYDPNAAPKPMHPVKIDAPLPCGCMADPVCDCRYQETVTPEIREVPPCPCLGQVGCGCQNGFKTSLVSTGCGCLALQVCPCRPKFVEPQIQDSHLEPELVHKSLDSCSCLMEAVCACRRPDHVVPEIREPPCSCADLNAINCACAAAGLRPNGIITTTQ